MNQTKLPLLSKLVSSLVGGDYPISISNNSLDDLAESSLEREREREKKKKKKTFDREREERPIIKSHEGGDSAAEEHAEITRVS